MFFADENNLGALKDFLNKAKDADAHADDDTSRRLSDVKQIIGFIKQHPADWDSRCTFNIQHIGNHFLSKLRNFDSSKKEDIEDIYSMTYRFLCEFDLLIGPNKELSHELRRLKSRIEQDSISDNKDASYELYYATYRMPVSILKEMLNTTEITNFLDFRAQANEAANLKKQWDAELGAKTEEVNNLKQKLEEHTTGFNFVGLYQGFAGLGTQKKKELKNLFRLLVLMGVAVLSPLLVEIAFIGYGLMHEVKLDSLKLLHILPIVTLVFVLIYFFRVVLQNYNSVRAQVIQIELRQTLCQFIQNYVDYSVKIKKQDAVALEKFENLIFSGIIADTDKLPSTFDGVEQIAGLVKAIKGEK